MESRRPFLNPNVKTDERRKETTVTTVMRTDKDNEEEADKSSVKYHSFWSDSAVGADFMHATEKSNQRVAQQVEQLGQHSIAENVVYKRQHQPDSHNSYMFYDCHQANDVDENNYDDVGLLVDGVGDGGDGGSNTNSAQGRSSGGTGSNRGDSGYHTTHSQCTYSTSCYCDGHSNGTTAITAAENMSQSSHSNQSNPHALPPSIMAPPPPPPPVQIQTPQIAADRAYLLEMQSRSRLPISIRSNLNLSGCVDSNQMSGMRYYGQIQQPVALNQDSSSVVASTAFKPLDPFRRNNTRRSLDSSIAANTNGNFFPDNYKKNT